MRFGNGWETDDSKCRLKLKNGTELYFRDASCESSPVTTGVLEGEKKTYTGFDGLDGVKIMTLCGKRFDGVFTAEIVIEGEKEGVIDWVEWPGPMKPPAGMEKGSGASVLSAQQGMYIPDSWQEEIQAVNTPVYERWAYLPFFGQNADAGKRGYTMIFDTPYDAAYSADHKPGEWTTLSPVWRTSLGMIRYRRILQYIFDSPCDYNRMAKRYRDYAKEHGRLVTLKQKIAANPEIAYLLGCPVIHTDIATHIHPKSRFYDEQHPENNSHYTTFARRAEQLRELKRIGLEKAYIHLDGWGKLGYDNLHPDPFPPHEAAGGAEGMKALSNTCRELGFRFGIHDQYRDYYHSAPSYSPENAYMNEDGTNPYCDVWNGGPHSWLCATLAPDYVRRNFAEFRKLGIQIDGAYLDVFSVVELDECFNPAHRMTRKECAEKRLECFDILRRQGIIPSSEEAVETMLPAISLCHHAPFMKKDWEDLKEPVIGIPLPLFNLVYHDCLVIPWFPTRGKAAWGMPTDGWGLLYAVLNGGTVYVDVEDTPEDLERLRPVLELHKQLACQEMVKHEFLDGSVRRQRTTFADGTEVTVDFEKCEYHVDRAKPDSAE